MGDDQGCDGSDYSNSNSILMRDIQVLQKI